MANYDWIKEEVQFPRLLAEIRAVGLTRQQMSVLQSSMDLSEDDIEDILERAEEVFEGLKEQRVHSGKGQ